MHKETLFKAAICMRLVLHYAAKAMQEHILPEPIEGVEGVGRVALGGQVGLGGQVALGGQVGLGGQAALGAAMEWTAEMALTAGHRCSHLD